jgi:ATP-binding cassette subfamily F protein 3
VRDLSGGEKGRLARAKFIYSRVNVLVLDEPTNHLDIPSRESLEEALDAYDGTIITISHDRYFLDRVATQILALDGAGGAEDYDGDYTEYHDWKAARASAGEAAIRSEQERNAAATVKAAAERATNQDGDARGKSKVGGGKGTKKKSEARAPQMIEAEIAEIEKRLAVLSEEMSLPEVARAPERLARLNEDYRAADERLRSLYEDWERVAAEATSI